MKTKNTNIILIISFIVFLCTLATFVYFLNVIKNKNRHTSAVLSAVDQKVSEIENRGAVFKKMEELNEINKKIGDYFVNPSRVDVFVEYLENLGTDNKVNLVVKSVEIPKKEKNKIIVSIDMGGSFQNIMKIIALLESAPYNIEINSAFLNKNNINETSKDGEVKTEWQSNISFSVLTL